MNVFTPSYNDIHNFCNDLVKQVTWNNHYPFDCVVGVARGGMISATIAAYMLNLPLFMVDYSSHAGEGDDKNHSNVIDPLPFEHKRILVIDDICDSGHTMNEIYNVYTNEYGYQVYTACMFYKQRDPQIFKVDFAGITLPADSPWVVFPYDNFEKLPVVLDDSHFGARTFYA